VRHARQERAERHQDSAPISGPCRSRRKGPPAHVRLDGGEEDDVAAALGGERESPFGQSITWLTPSSS
jgi:hypothetical protein